MNIPKRQHYIPQFYLRYFGIKQRKTHQIFAYDVQEEKPFSSTVDKVAKEKDYYDLKLGDNLHGSIEPSLSEFEDITAPVYKRFVNHMNPHLLDLVNRTIIAAFISSLFSRVPRSREMTDLIEDAVRQDFVEKGLKGFEKYTLTEDQKQKHDINMIWVSIREFTSKIFAMQWRVGLVKQDLMLITSDSPIVMCNPRECEFGSNIGIMVPGIEIMIPLTPYLLLIMYHSEDNYLPEQIIPLNFEAVENHNRLQVLYATRFLYSQRPYWDVDTQVRKYRQLVGSR